MLGLIYIYMSFLQLLKLVLVLEMFRLYYFVTISTVGLSYLKHEPDRTVNLILLLNFQRSLTLTPPFMSVLRLGALQARKQ